MHSCAMVNENIPQNFRIIVARLRVELTNWWKRMMVHSIFKFVYFFWLDIDDSYTVEIFLQI